MPGLRFSTLLRVAALLACIAASGCGGQAAPRPAAADVTLAGPESDLHVLEAGGTGGGLRGEPSARRQAEGITPHPRDLHDSGGPVIATARSFHLYVNCSASCWGNPGTFAQNLAASAMIHVADQYTGSNQNGRYAFGGALIVHYPELPTLEANDIYSIVHAASRQYGGGYGTLYHVFLPQGTNVCMPIASQCYSPANAQTWKFCGYHGYATFGDTGHVLFSIVPYQAVSSSLSSCMINGASPNGRLTDSTDSTLSHETFEMITDPDETSRPAWTNASYGEIGDICSPAEGQLSGIVTLNGTNYGIQPEYTNAHHRCAFSP